MCPPDTPRRAATHIQRLCESAGSSASPEAEASATYAPQSAPQFPGRRWVRVHAPVHRSSVPHSQTESGAPTRRLPPSDPEGNRNLLIAPSINSQQHNAITLRQPSRRNCATGLPAQALMFFCRGRKQPLKCAHFHSPGNRASRREQCCAICEVLH